MLREQYMGEVVSIFDSTITKLPYKSEVELIYCPEELIRNITRYSHFIVCVGNEYGYARSNIAVKLKKLGVKPLSVLHEKAFIESTSTVGAGLQAMPGSIVHKFCDIGDDVILNTNSTIDHECLIGNGCHVMGSASVAGRVTIESYVTIGTNATILPNLTIGEGAYIGAGAVVTKNVPPFSVYAGVPAKKIRDTYHKFDNSVFKILGV
eukprot:TRINITY_DN4715_c0_g1_i1.p1 TRINITY_DN4715_c0_g1~~TRINITY_DN4715_c0_g1_i1.p1  ORF type:complete len:208 (-),score=17.64 TRINITY_DN4715_c0_g1_i1:588-1211(-)